MHPTPPRTAPAAWTASLSASPSEPTRAERATAVAIVVALALGWFAATAASHRSGPWDNIEQLVWAQAVQWGYYKHPPLPTWLLAAATLPFGPRVEVTWALGTACVAIGLWLTWRLGCELMGARRATVGLLLSSTVAHYSVRALYYNHNLAMLPFVAAAALLLHRALRDGRPRQWIGFGLAAGLGALCKYQIVVFAACWGAAVLVARRDGTPAGTTVTGGGIGRGAGLALAALAGLLVVAPHLVWLVEHDFLPFRYADRQLERLDGARAWLGNLALFASAQLGRCAPVALAVALCAWRLRRRSRPEAEEPVVGAGAPQAGAAHAAFGPGACEADAPPSRADWRFLLLVGLGPFALTWVLGVAKVRLEGHWSAPELLALGLVIVARWPAAGTRRALTTATVVVAALQLVMAVGFAFGRGVLPHLTGRLARSVYPVQEVADAVAAQWRMRTDAPLALIAGETWEAGMVALNVSPRARVVIDATLDKAPGVDAGMLARCGAMVVWDTTREAELPAAVIRLREAGIERGTVAVAWSDASRARPIVLGWSMLAPSHDPVGGGTGRNGSGPATEPPCTGRADPMRP